MTRPIRFTRAFTDHAAGSVLVECGRTKVLCTASVQEQIPMWMKVSGQRGGWLTAEYSMLPSSTTPRKIRDGRAGRGPDARSLEIQRLVGRALRSAIDLSKMPDVTVWVDCDVISADGGTRTTAINGAMVALYDTLLWMEEEKKIRDWPLRGLVSAISVGSVKDQLLVDLDYSEDSVADVDMNLVVDEQGHLVEVQGSAEGRSFTLDENHEMLKMAHDACMEIQNQQRQLLGL